MRTVIALAVVLALGLAATAQAELLKGDPRVCAQSTPGGQTKHAFYCAQYAAVAAVKAKMAAREKVAKWFYPVLCDRVAGSLLRWRCSLVKGGPYATATVRFSRTASGWTRAVTVVMAP